MRAHDWSGVAAGPARRLAAIAAHRRPAHAQHRPPDVHLVGSGAAPASTTTPTATRSARSGTPARWAGRRARCGPRSGTSSARRSSRCMSGRGATWHVDQLVPITRHGRRRGRLLDLQLQPDRRRDRAAAASAASSSSAPRRRSRSSPRASSPPSATGWRSCSSRRRSSWRCCSGPEHRFEIANPALPAAGRPSAGASARPSPKRCPKRSSQGYVALLDSVFASGQAYSANGAKYEMQATPDGPAERALPRLRLPADQGCGRRASRASSSSART